MSENGQLAIDNLWSEHESWLVVRGERHCV